MGLKGKPVINEALATKVNADEDYLKSQISNLKSKLTSDTRKYRGDKSPLNLKIK